MQRRPFNLKSLLALCVAAALAGNFASAQEEESKDKAAKKHDVSGTWQWEREQQGQKIVTTLRLKQKGNEVSGTMIGQLGEIDFKGGEIDGEKLSFEVVLERNGLEIPLYFEGTVAEESIDGLIEIDFMGNVREFPWKPKRAIYLPDILGTWQFHIEADDGQVFEPTLKLTPNVKNLSTSAKEEAEEEGDEKKEKAPVKGVYTSQLGEAEAKDMKLTGREIAFTILYEQDGQQFVIKYKGKPQDGAIKGTVDYDFGGVTGSLPFEGKKLPEKKKEGDAADKEKEDKSDEDDDK